MLADIEKSMAKLEGSKALFEQMIRNIENNFNEEYLDLRLN